MVSLRSSYLCLLLRGWAYRSTGGLGTGSTQYYAFLSSQRHGADSRSTGRQHFSDEQARQLAPPLKRRKRRLLCIVLVAYIQWFTIVSLPQWSRLFFPSFCSLLARLSSGSLCSLAPVLGFLRFFSRVTLELDISACWTSCSIFYMFLP